MSDTTIPVDHDALSELLNDAVMVRIVMIVNLASLSILELLEYGVTRKDVNRAMAKGVIEFDKSPMPSAPQMLSKGEVIRHVLETGDYYFGVLSSKVKLTKLGLYILEIIETSSTHPEPSQDLPQEEVDNLYNMPTPHQ